MTLSSFFAARENAPSPARQIWNRWEFAAMSALRRVRTGRRTALGFAPADIERLLATSNRVVRGYVQSQMYNALTRVPRDGVVLDVGSSQRCVHPRALTIDLQKGADLEWNLMKGLPFRSETIDLCVCTAVLEHVPEPDFVVAEMRRVLKPGGRVHAAIPFLQPFHAAPTDFQRYTLSGIRRLFHDFVEEDVGFSSGFGETLAWIMREWRGVALPQLQQGVLREVFVERWDEVERAVAGLDQNADLHSDPRRGLHVAGGIYFEGMKR
jgi:SAM-dependent methyltransferase